MTYHIIRDELEMTQIDIDLVHIEDASNLPKDSGASRFHTV